MGSPFFRSALQVLLLLLAGASGMEAHGGEALDRVQAKRELRVCIWPEYLGITYRKPMTNELKGLDIDMAAMFGRELGVQVVYVDSSFTTVADDLRRDVCDIAMFAMAVTPERAAAMRFSMPYLQSDVYAVAHRGSHAVREWADIDRPGIRVAVQQGTYLEPLMDEVLQHAQLVSIRPPITRETELMAGRVDVFMTNFTYSRRLASGSDWGRLISPPRPLYMRPYAYATRFGDDAWNQRVNAFVFEVRNDGRLLRAAQQNGLATMVIPAR